MSLPIISRKGLRKAYEKIPPKLNAWAGWIVYWSPTVSDALGLSLWLWLVEQRVEDGDDDQHDDGACQQTAHDGGCHG